jgi:Asp-tRNA(Asn)/Glu-tRNA(Gln) amidotransferase A subunit family amidase
LDREAKYNPVCKLPHSVNVCSGGANELKDNAEVVEGAPGAVQIMGRPMRDEELIEIMKVVEIVLEKAT